MQLQNLLCYYADIPYISSKIIFIISICYIDDREHTHTQTISLINIKMRLILFVRVHSATIGIFHKLDFQLNTKGDATLLVLYTHQTVIVQSQVMLCVGLLLAIFLYAVFSSSTKHAGYNIQQMYLCYFTLFILESLVKRISSKK